MGRMHAVVYERQGYPDFLPQHQREETSGQAQVFPSISLLNERQAREASVTPERIIVLTL